MASIPFTLAALATSAVPNLEVTGVRLHEGEPDYASVAIITDRGDLMVRVPRTQAAEIRQSAELLGLAALSEGSRSILPFAVPETLGLTRAGETRAVVSTLLPGARFTTEDLREDALLIGAIAESLAAIHDLPSTIAHQGGLPVRSARDLRLQATRLVDRADTTRLLPKSVRESWQRSLESAELWDFAPTIVHGTLDAEHLVVADDRVTGIEGWSELSIGDPATDLSWLLAAGTDVFETVLARYSRLRSAGSTSALRARAVFYRQLEIARWLLHGVEAHDQEIIDDAVAMLDRLVDKLGTAAPLTAHTALNEEQVEAMLDETPEVVDRLSETAAYEALDEDRMFGFEPAFVDEADFDPESGPETKSDGAPAPEDSAPEDTAPQNTAADDQATSPIADEKLPRGS